MGYVETDQVADPVGRYLHGGIADRQVYALGTGPEREKGRLDNP
jgi:hypothetical protein